jgi:ParB family chromosome partitioning protein
MAGLTTIPCMLVEISDLDSAVIAIIENLQRQNLHFLEEAEGFANLIGDYAFTQEALAERVGKNQSTVANKLRLLRLPRAVQKFIIEHGLSERHARALLKLEDEDMQMEVLEKIVGENLNVRKSERVVDELVEKSKPQQLTLGGKTVPFTAYIRDIRILTNTIQENLDIVRKSGMETRFDMQQTDTGYSIFIQLEYAQNAHGRMNRRAA